MSHRIVGLPVAALLLVAACNDEGPQTVTQDAGMITVTGEVTEKDDQVPVDGGVTMVLKLDDGSNATLLFGSLFTAPPPTQAQLDLYNVIVRVNVGDRVKAEGKPSDGGIVLEGLTILKPK